MAKLTDEEKAKLRESATQLLKHAFPGECDAPHIAILDGEDAEPALWTVKAWCSQEDCLAGYEPNVNFSGHPKESEEDELADDEEF